MDALDTRACWSAVRSRDGRLDGAFVYAVRTTGIYCRPSCPARRPRRENVEFLPGPEEAETRGYRPCRRCHPRSRGRTPAEVAILRALEFLEDHLLEPVPLSRLGDAVGMSPAHLQRVFSERVGLSPRAYQGERRLERLKERLRAGDTVSRATFEAGFDSGRSLYERAREGLGMTPGRYRRGGAGLQIRYTTTDSPLGRILIAATEIGVCAVSLGDEDGALVAELVREFPRARVERDDPGLQAWAREVAERAAGTLSPRWVPVDLMGTVFQLRVWKALREIPPGATRSYGALAAAVGHPRGARAVARACATNRVALVVPCHRAVAADGGLAGYRWGVERKERLLRGEGGTGEAGRGEGGAG